MAAELTKFDQFLLELEYGISPLQHRLCDYIQYWPRHFFDGFDATRKHNLFEKQDFWIRNHYAENLARNTRFERAFQMLTNCRGKYVPYSEGIWMQQRQTCESEHGDRWIVWCKRAHKDNLHIEVTLRYFQENNPNPQAEHRTWQLMLGLNYREQAQPVNLFQARGPSVEEIQRYREQDIPSNNCTAAQKFPLLNETYTAAIVQKGEQNKSEVIDHAITQYCNDPRLKTATHRLHTLVSRYGCEKKSGDSGRLSSADPAIVQLIREYQLEAREYDAQADEHKYQRE